MSIRSKAVFANSMLVAGLVAFVPDVSVAESQTQGDVVYLDQGWDEETRNFYYYQTQGTAMLPLAFFKFLEQADSEKLFSDPEHLMSLGVIPGEKDEKLNPEGLPVGLALNKVEDGLFQGEWVGFTCSSCHQGELNYEGKRIRIDGGSNNVFSMPHFAEALSKATHATIKDDEKMGRLLQRSGAGVAVSRDQLRAGLEEVVQYIDYFVERVAGSPYDFGPGRMDALNQIHNTITAVYPQALENVGMTTAPTKSPFVWNTPQSAWVQWTGTQHLPIYRNLAESLGAMVRVNIDPDKGEMFDSTVNFRNQLEIERDLQTLAPPQWPEDVLGEIDRDLAAKGKELAQEVCSSCHTSYPFRWSPPREQGKRFVENALVPQEYVGTDGMQFQSQSLVTYPNVFTGLMHDLLPEPYKGKDAAPAPTFQGVLQKGVVDKYVPELGLTEDEWLAWRNYSLASDEEGAPKVPSYKAAPLDGMWATPPFLHNGSVPSIYELLKPASERATTWKQGTEFDPKTVGLDTSGETGSYEVDTSLVGLSNAGHSFEDGPLGGGVVGRALSEDERWAIVEYLKTLPESSDQFAPFGGPEGSVTDAWAEDSGFFNATQPSGYFNGEGDPPSGYPGGERALKALTDASAIYAEESSDEQDEAAKEQERAEAAKVPGTDEKAKDN